MLIYAYYENLTKSDKILFTKCHTIHDKLYKEAYKLLSVKLVPIYGTPHMKSFTLTKLSARELQMVIDNILPVGLDLDIDFKAYTGLRDHKLFFPVISHTINLNIPILSLHNYCATSHICVIILFL